MGMLLLRYQRQRQEEECGGRRDTSASDHEMRRTKINDRDLKGDSHRAATRGTLICIFVCGTALLSLGVGLLCVGLLAPPGDPTPWLVTGPTCIVLGILVLLLSVEIILKLRRISSSSTSSSTADDAPAKKKEDSVLKDAMTHTLPVVLHPASPLQQLDAASLPVQIVQHR